MRSLVLSVTLIVAMGVIVAHYADKAVNAPNGKSNYSDAMTTTSASEATRIATAPPPPQPPRTSSSQAPSKPALPQVITLSPPSGRSVTLRGDGTGHFQTVARVDGRRVEFLVDTGASAVVLRASTAARLGIHPAASEYTARVITANGEIRAAVVQLNAVEIGDITVRDVRALVQSDETLAMDLLGMTFLSRVRWTHDRGKLVIEQ